MTITYSEINRDYLLRNRVMGESIRNTNIPYPFTLVAHGSRDSVTFEVVCPFQLLSALIGIERKNMTKTIWDRFKSINTNLAEDVATSITAEIDGMDTEDVHVGIDFISSDEFKEKLMGWHKSEYNSQLVIGSGSVEINL